MIVLGIDLGTSSIKVSLVDAISKKVLASTQYPEVEASIISHKTGWAEQEPEQWWSDTQKALLKLKASNPNELLAAKAIGISYQMHGLVMIDENQNVLRPSIIWCDSRAVEMGEKAFKKIGESKALESLLNSPGNFTASKLAWVKENEPEIFNKCTKMLLPGDFLAMKLTGEISTSCSALSEGIFWDFKEGRVSKDILNAFGFEESLIPEIKAVFSNHGKLKVDVARSLGLSSEASVCYKAGDQPNNALSLNVLEPGEIAATAGTSGVIYAVSDEVKYDLLSRVNSFAHVNHGEQNRIGILLCINGTGILNRWIKDTLCVGMNYGEMNELAQSIAIGAEGLSILPFGNGAERVLGNQNLGASLQSIDFNRHTRAHIIRASQEGIAYSFRYGFEIMKGMGLQPKMIKAGKANMFLSDVFTESVVNAMNVPVQMYDTDGAKGAALGAAYGCRFFSNLKDTFDGLTLLNEILPERSKIEAYEEAYQRWLGNLKLA